MSDGKNLELVRGLGTWTSAAIVVGTMIGTGIFLKPAEMAADAGLSVGAGTICGRSGDADDYSVACAARAVVHRPRTDPVRVIFLSQLAEKASRHSATRRQVPAVATRARTKPAADGVRLARCPA